MDLGLDGRIAVVTGGASGIGLAISEQLLAEGAVVIVLDRAADVLEESRRRLGSKGIIEGELVDVSDSAAFRDCLDAIVRRHGRIDILVNNVGIARFSGIVDMTDEDWEAVLDTNLGSVRTATRFIVPIMRDQGGGAIVNISSIVAERAQINSSAYAASKAAIQQFTAVTAVEHAADNIRANTVRLGAVLTEGSEQFRKDFPEHYERTVMAIPVKRWAEPREVAQVVTFLVSDCASYINGTCIAIDGGMAVAAAS